MALLEKNDILFAHKALNMIAGLSANARRVAGAIIDHFNRKTGQCDPSVERLAKLLGIDRATVLRATAELCSDKFKLFEKSSHGGKFNTASYVPCWSVFRAIVSDWDDQMKRDKRPEKVAELRRSRSQSCDVDGRRTATQTNLNNQSNKPINVEPVYGQGENLPSSRSASRSQGLGKGRGQTGQSFMMLPIAGGKQTSHSEAAKRGAERRWFEGLKGLDPRLSFKVMEELGSRTDVYAAATEAELQRKGSGLRYVLQALQEPLSEVSYG